MVFLDAAGFGNDGVPVGGGGLDDRVTVEALPFLVTESVVVECFELDAQVRFETIAVVDVRVFVGLSAQLFDKVVLEGGFALVVLFFTVGRMVETDDREFIGDDNRLDTGTVRRWTLAVLSLRVSFTRPRLTSGRFPSRPMTLIRC